MSSSFKIQSIRRYPVKGFQGETLETTALNAGALLPGDRAWGFTSGQTATADIDDGVWMKKAHFLQLMRFAELANLSVKFTNDTDEATLFQANQPIISGPLNDPIMAAQFCKAVQDIMQAAGADFPQNIGVRHLSDGGFSDTKAPWISVGGTASLADFGAVTDTEGHPERFRLNLWLTTTTPCEELGWIGKRAKVGTAIIRFMEPVGRCAAINVNPNNAERAGDLPAQMRAHYGHDDLGVFALVETSGMLSNNDELTLLD